MPRLKLSDRSIYALKPTGKQTFYWDTAQVGLGILVSAATKSYVAKGPLNGKGVLKVLGRVDVMSLPEARQAAREMFRDLGAGIDPRKTRTTTATLAEALAAYLGAHDLGARTKADYADIVARYFRDWHDLPLKDITRELVEARHRAIAEEVEQRHAALAQERQALHLQRAERVDRQWPEAAQRHRAKAAAAAEHAGYSGKASANVAMRVLRAIYNFALDRNPDLPPNPVRLRRQWHKVRPRERHLGADDLPKFYQAVLQLASPIGRDYLLLVLFTGLRRREAAALRWTDVDLTNRSLTIPAERTKAGRKLDLPLTDFIHDLLVARRAIGKTEFIFHAASRSGHIEEPKFFIEQQARTSGVQVTVHDLRRTFITIAESCDISPIALKALVNHGLGPDVTSGYIQMNVERLRAPAQKVADRIKELCGVAEAPGAIRLRG